MPCAYAGANAKHAVALRSRCSEDGFCLLPSRRCRFLMRYLPLPSTARKASTTVRHSMMRAPLSRPEACTLAAAGTTKVRKPSCGMGGVRGAGVGRVGDGKKQLGW